MTVSTLRPNGTGTNSGVTLTGAASAHAATSDDVDTSYITVVAGGFLSLTFGDLTLPAGASIDSVKVKTRTAKAGASPGSLLVSDIPVVPSSATVTWASPTTHTIGTAFNESDAAVDALSPKYTINSASLKMYEAYLDVIYVAKPTLTVDAPTGTVSDSNEPTVEWTATFDTAGPFAFTSYSYEVKVFNDAQYTAGGFDPDTSTPFASVSGAGATIPSSWQIDTPLPDDTYRAYVQVSQFAADGPATSDWEFSGFIISVLLPAVPSISSVVDSANGRITVTITDTPGGDATTDGYDLQRSLDGGTTWETVRQLVSGLLPSASPAVVYDYEAPIGTLMNYRVRTAHNYSGVYAYSDWDTDTATWTTTEWWLKDPIQPALNQSIKVRDLAPVQRADRSGTFQALGATTAVVIADTRGPKTGTITLRESTLAAQDAVDALLDVLHTLLLQGPADQNPPGYVRLAGQSRTRAITGGSAELVFDEIEYTAVSSPTSDVTAWP